MLSPGLARFLPAACLLGFLAFAYGFHPNDGPGKHTARPDELIRRPPGCFVPNLGQWRHPARFVHRSGPMTLFLRDRGWVVDLRGVAVEMSFEGDERVPRVAGEKKLPGHHDYFLGDDASRWRTEVPLYASVRYEDLYPGIDLRLREAKRNPEYDLLLEPGADLSQVTVQVEGAKALSLADDGSLVIETALGPLTQRRPETWQVDGDGRESEVACSYSLLDSNRFGFEAPGWDGDTSLTIDPGLIWSTFLGGALSEGASALSVDPSGVVTVVGMTMSATYPTSTGAYDRTFNGRPPNYETDVFVSRLDPSRSGSAQLLYSTFLGGTRQELATALAVDALGVVTLAGQTASATFPTTGGAYDSTYNGPGIGFYRGDAFVARLDPRKSGNAQLVYSSFLGASSRDQASSLSVDGNGVMTLAGETRSSNFPTTSGGYDTSFNGYVDAFVSRLDPRKTGRAQLVYSSFLGGSGYDYATALCVDPSGVVTVAGQTRSANFPVSSSAYDRTLGGTQDTFISRLDPRRSASAQLVYSSFFGGSGSDSAWELFVDRAGVTTLAGHTSSSNLPTSSGAFDTTFNGGFYDAFVGRLDLRKTPSTQLVYSTFLGGSASDRVSALSVDADGVVTVAGTTDSPRFPVTSGAYDTSHGGAQDVFASRLDPRRSGSAQLTYSSYLGGNDNDDCQALFVDPSGTAILGGTSLSLGFPTTSGAYDRTRDGQYDVVVSRLDMGVPLWGDRHQLSLGQGGSQTLTLSAGKPHANKLYFLVGTLSGTTPGIPLGNGVILPLNFDPYFGFTLAAPNSPLLASSLGRLDASGNATARWNVLPWLPQPPVQGFLFHHAYVVIDPNRLSFDHASNAVPLLLLR